MKKPTKYIKRMPAEATRALKEANHRNKNKAKSNLPKELGGRDGPEPIRFGDWEKNGIASDF